jgi:hypothetical protein
MFLSLLPRRIYASSRSTPAILLHSVVTDSGNSLRTATNSMKVCQSNQFIRIKVSARSFSLFRFGNSRLGRQNSKIPSVRRHSLNIANAHVTFDVTARLPVVQRCNLSDIHTAGRVITTVTRRRRPLRVERSTGPRSVHRPKFLRGRGRPSRIPQMNPSSNSPWHIRWARSLLTSTKYALNEKKFTKLESFGSMVLSVGVYSMIFDWPFAVGIVGLIFCHECGHLAMMSLRGMPSQPMVFIPFSTY